MTDLNEIFAKCKHPDRHQLAGYIEAQTGLPAEPAATLALDFLDRFVVLERAQPTDPYDIELARLQRAQEAVLAELLSVVKANGDAVPAWKAHQTALTDLLRHAQR